MDAEKEQMLAEPLNEIHSDAEGKRPAVADVDDDVLAEQLLEAVRLEPRMPEDLYATVL